MLEAGDTRRRHSMLETGGMGRLAPDPRGWLVMSKAARFVEMKRQGERIAMVTAYDAPTARAAVDAGMDVLLVGDSVGTNMLGYASERDVTMDDMVHHGAAVRRGAPDAFVIVDLPYRSYETPAMALLNARRLVAAGADMVKFEGPHPDIVAALVGAGIPVCGHLGLEPQNHVEKRLKGRSATDARVILEDARALDAAGLSMLVLEVIPEELGAAITAAIAVPTIGIGAGRHTDGQVLVVCDLLGFTEANFKHNKRYETIGARMQTAMGAYVADVQAGRFPAESNAFHMKAEEHAAFAA
jgi:3-methyl-2-oxobutanoate hydroxymethyltransferase